MDESFKCFCGCKDFWFIKFKVRCQNCLSEYSPSASDVNKLVYRKWNSEKNVYGFWLSVEWR